MEDTQTKPKLWLLGECVYKDSFHGDFHEEETVQSQPVEH